MPFGKLPKRYGGIVMPMLLSVLMTCVVSAISVVRSQGLDAAALSSWPSTWLLSWLIAFPVLLVVMPAVRKLSGLVVEA